MSSNEVSRLLVIGSGYIGLEVADALNKPGSDVTILEKEELPLPSADKEVRSLISDLLSKNNISFFSSDDTTDFVIRNNRLSQLKYQGRFIDYDIAIVAAGVYPNVVLAEETGLKIGRYGGVVVDNRMRTSDPNIYAAGDVVEFKNFITKKSDYLPLATNAHILGHVAGENAAGIINIAEPILLNSAFKLCNKFIVQVGLSQKQAEDYSMNAMYVSAIANNKVKVMPNSNKVFGKIIFDKYSGLLLGASFVGSEEVSGYADIISAMIYNKNKATNLANIKYNYTPSLSPFINLLSILGRKIKEKIQWRI